MDSKRRAKQWLSRKLRKPEADSGQATPARTGTDSGQATPANTGQNQNVDKETVVGAEVLAAPESYATDDELPPKEDEASATNPKSLWDLAYEALRKEKPGVVQAYEELMSKVSPYLANASPTTDLNKILSNVSTDVANIPITPNAKTAQGVASQQKMMDIIDLGQKHMEGKQIAFKIGQQKFVLQDHMEHVVAGVQLGKDWIDDAVQASPLASAAWAGVCLFLPLLTNPSEVQAANEEGLAYVTHKIRHFTAMEPLLLYGEDEKVLAAAARQICRDRLVELYQAIIDFQAQSVLRFFRGRFSNFVRDAVKWDSWEELLGKVKELGSDVENRSLQINIALSRAALGELVQWQKESQEDKCLQSFKRGDYVWYKDRVKDRVPDTCLWFLNHASYQSWLKADAGPLLVSADPGCGKSVLAKYLIDSRFGFRLPREVAVCYFFFKDLDQNTIDLVLCALIHQLLCLRPQLMRHALPKYKQNGSELAKDATALWSILESATADPKAGTVLIVLDALDECLQDERNLETLSRYVRTHFDTGLGHLKIIMTSRPYQGTIQHIQKLEKSFPNIRIKGEDDSETIREEINSVIEHRVDRMEKFNDDLRKHLKQRLNNIPHRTYLWLYLVFNHLEKFTIKNTIRGLDEAVSSLPETVDQAYEKILNRSPKPIETRKAILILLAAYRPLTLLEMQITLELILGTSCKGDLDLESDEAFRLRLRDWCGLFVTVYDGKIYFLHQTAREFLLPLAASSPRPTIAHTSWAHTFSMHQAHTVFADILVGRVLGNRNTCTSHNFDFPASLLALPELAGIYEYAMQHWASHASEASVDGTTLPSVLDLLHNKKNINWMMRALNRLGSSGGKNVSALHLAAGFGLWQYFADLSQNGSLDERDNDGETPLSWAAGARQEEAFLKLVELGADVDVRDAKLNTPLHHAAEHRWDRALRILLLERKSSATLNLDNMTALHYAVKSGWTDSIPLFVEAGWDINVPVQRRARTHRISEARNLELRSLPQQTGKSRNYPGLTPLHFAAICGRGEMARCLLGHGANPGARSEHGETPLHLAVSRDLKGDTLFYDSWDDRWCRVGWDLDEIDPESTEWDMASMRADMYMRDMIGELLCFPNIDVNEHDDDGTQPLHITAAYTSRYMDMTLVAKMLLDSGAELSGRNNKGETPLLVACRQGNYEVARQLLNYEADMTEVDDKGCNALHCAAASKDLNIISLILQECKTRGLNLARSRDMDQRNALHHLLRHTICSTDPKMLLDAGVEINGVDKDGLTPLALYFGEYTPFLCANEELDILLKAGADATFKTPADSQGLGHLYAAHCLNLQVETLRLLSGAGADLHAADAGGRTILHHAAYIGSLTEETLEFLLGGDVRLSLDAADASGMTPLDCAVEGRARFLGRASERVSSDGVQELFRGQEKRRRDGVVDLLREMTARQQQK